MLLAELCPKHEPPMKSSLIKVCPVALPLYSPAPPVSQRTYLAPKYLRSLPLCFSSFESSARLVVIEAHGDDRAVGLVPSDFRVAGCAWKWDEPVLCGQSLGVGS